MAMLESVKITKDSQTELEALFNKEETPKSFLDYCLHIGNSAPDYWQKIYNRIGITWETKDKYDYINYAIEYGNGKTTTSNIQVQEPKPSLGILRQLKKLFKTFSSK